MYDANLMWTQKRLFNYIQDYTDTILEKKSKYGSERTYGMYRQIDKWISMDKFKFINLHTRLYINDLNKELQKLFYIHLLIY